MEVILMSFSRFVILFWEAGNKAVRYRRRKWVCVPKRRERRGMAEVVGDGEDREERAMNRVSDEGDARSASRENIVSVPAVYTASFNCGDQ